LRLETIHYERKVSDGSYGNRALSLTASVDEGEDVALAIGQLILLVRGHLAQDEREEDDERQRKQEEQMERYRAEQTARQAQWERERLERGTLAAGPQMQAQDDLDEDDDDDDEEGDEEPEF